MTATTARDRDAGRARVGGTASSSLVRLAILVGIAWLARHRPRR